MLDRCSIQVSLDKVHVFHRGLEYKLERDLPKEYYQILKSYISDRHFRVKYEEEYSELKKISAGVPQVVSLDLSYICFILETYQDVKR